MSLPVFSLGRARAAMNVATAAVLGDRAGPLTPVGAQRVGWYPMVVHEPTTGAWQRNEEVRPETVLAHPTVFACTSLLMNDLGKIRPKLVEQDENGIWTETYSAAFSPVLRRPNHYQNHIQFKQAWMASKLAHGNTYGFLQRDGRGVVSAVHILDPTRVTVLLAPDGAVYYQLQQDYLAGVEDAGGIAVPASEIAHDRGPALFHPLVGLSPLFACAVAAGLGLEIVRNGRAFFANGSNPSGILVHPNPITLEKSKELTALWNGRYSGAGSGGVAVLGDGMTFTPMRMSAVDAQLAEQLGLSDETIARAFGVPAFKVGVGQAPTYQNGEIRNQDYYSDSLQIHIEAFELCMDEALGLKDRKVEGRTLGVELDLDDLLRMDQATMMKTLGEGVKTGILSPNGARRRLGEKPVVGGDTPYLQQQNYSLAALDARDRRADPFATVQPTPEPPRAEPAEAEARRAIATRIRLRAKTLRMAA